MSTVEENVIVNGNAETIAGLRGLADWLEANPECPKLDASASLYDWGTIPVGAAARLLGAFKKEAYGDSYTLRKSFSKGVQVKFIWSRETTCEKTVTRAVAKVKDYTPQDAEKRAKLLAELGAIEQIEVEKEVEVVTWHCPESILAGAKE